MVAEKLGKTPEAHAGPRSYSQSPELTSSELVAQFQPLSIEPKVAQRQEMQPASRKSMRFPLRPWKGIYGARCVVKANHFFVELPDKDLHQYDVSITPEVTFCGVDHAVMEQLVKLYQKYHLGKILSAYDGRKSLYTAGPLPFALKEFKTNLSDEEDGLGGSRREREFKVVIKFRDSADLHYLGMFLQGKQADAPQEALQVFSSWPVILFPLFRQKAFVG